MNRRQQLCAVLLLAGMFIFIIVVTVSIRHVEEKPIVTTAEVVSKPALVIEPAQTETPVDPTESVYTFLQGPKSWSEKRPWSGVWGKTMLDGGSFGGFGCGLCCMANIYSTHTPYQCSPLDMYRYARKHSEYWGGAIEWQFIKENMESLGFTCSLQRKPATYPEFIEQVNQSMSCIMLVSSAQDSSYWKNTPGHYVTTFLYQPQEGKVFLGDSGDPNHNRQWVKLNKIYKALKTASRYQYLTVNSYDDTKNRWKRNKIADRWVSPK